MLVTALNPHIGYDSKQSSFFSLLLTLYARNACRGSADSEEGAQGEQDTEAGCGGAGLPQAGTVRPVGPPGEHDLAQALQAQELDSAFLRCPCEYLSSQEDCENL